ncbi:MAG TPA: hypothetical protein VH370_22400 [Humisphaera sp.]|nr:hypothetical protein [Humisphaera sp.]
MIWLWLARPADLSLLDHRIIHSSYSGDIGVEASGFHLALPFSMVLSITLLPALAWYLLHCHDQRVWRQRVSAGLCPRCGYDLRATPKVIGPKLDKCPECGVDPGAPRVKPKRNERYRSI